MDGFLKLTIGYWIFFHLIQGGRWTGFCTWSERTRDRACTAHFKISRNRNFEQQYLRAYILVHGGRVGKVAENGKLDRKYQLGWVQMIYINQCENDRSVFEKSSHHFQNPYRISVILREKTIFKFKPPVFLNLNTGFWNCVLCVYNSRTMFTMPLERARKEISNHTKYSKWPKFALIRRRNQ